MNKALVIFESDGDEHPLSRFMRLTHVFLAYSDGRAWIKVDAERGKPLVSYLAADDDFDLETFYRGQGHKVLTGTIPEDRPMAPQLVLGNCVGLVKAFIGVRSWAITPYGLYRHMLGTGRWT